MNRIVLIFVGIVFVVAVVFLVKKNHEGTTSSGENPSAVASPSAETHPAKDTPSVVIDASGVPVRGGHIVDAEKKTVRGGHLVDEKGKPVTQAGRGGHLTDANGKPVSGLQVVDVDGKSVPGGQVVDADGKPISGGSTIPGEAAGNGGQIAIPKPTGKATSAAEIHDGVDGNIGVAHPGDDGEGAPAQKPSSAPTLAGIKTPRVWLVAADLKKLSSVKGASPLEIGNADGAKATPWKNRSGTKMGDGVRAKGGTTATFVRELQTTVGTVDAVAICAPPMSGCLNSQPSQIKLGLDINHPDSWVNGVDKSGKSEKGGGSFTALFVAARGSAAGNPLMENQNGEAGARKGPFLGWIGADLVGSIHGLQGIVGMNAAAIPSVYTGGVTPQIYTLRFDRKKSELKLYLIGEKGAITQVQSLEKGDGPDDDQYAAIAMGSKNPGKNAMTYVLEGATYARALEEWEICAIHKDWNKRYSLKLPKFCP